MPSIRVGQHDHTSANSGHAHRLAMRGGAPFFSKLLKLDEPIAKSVAGDEACVDGANRGPNDPVRLHPGLVQRLRHTPLARAESPAPWMTRTICPCERVLKSSTARLTDMFDMAQSCFSSKRKLK